MTRRTIGITAATIALTAATALVAGCGSSQATSTSADSPRKAAAATEPVLDCPIRTHGRSTLTISNATGVPVTVSSGGAALCNWFSGAGNPTTSNGVTIPPGGTRGMRLELTHKTGQWSTSFLVSGDRLIGRASITFESWVNGEAGDGRIWHRSVRIHGPDGWQTSRGLGSVREAGGTWRDVWLVGGGNTSTLKIAYVR